MSGGAIETRVRTLGLRIPEAARPVANYLPWTMVGRLVYVSGQLSISGERRIVGAVGAEVDPASAQEGARLCALNLLAQVRAAAGGDLDRISQVVRLGAFVQASADFNEIPTVVNGASNLMVEILADRGRHARSAVGVYRLPLNAAVEIDGVFELHA